MAGDPTWKFTPQKYAYVEMLVVVVGGLGISQMSDIEAALQAPGRKVISAGKLNGYNADLEAIIRANPAVYVAAIGHSFAAIPILKLAEKNLLDYAAFIDPVSMLLGVSKYRMPKPPPRFYWCRRSGFGVEVEMTIEDAGEPDIVQGGHNDLPHTSIVIARLKDDLAELPTV